MDKTEDRKPLIKIFDINSHLLSHPSFPLSHFETLDEVDDEFMEYIHSVVLPSTNIISPNEVPFHILENRKKCLSSKIDITIQIRWLNSYLLSRKIEFRRDLIHCIGAYIFIKYGRYGIEFALERLSLSSSSISFKEEYKCFWNEILPIRF